MFPPHITYFVFNVLMGRSLFLKCFHISFNQWSSACRVRPHQLKLEILLAVESSTSGLILKKSDIFHRGTGRVVPTARAGGKGKHRRVLLRVACVCEIEIDSLSLQEVHEEHHEDDHEDNSEVSAFASRDSNGR